MSREERSEWIVFAMRWAAEHEDPDGTRCPCGPCNDRITMAAWARGEHDHRPPDDLLRWTLLRHDEGEAHRLTKAEYDAAVKADPIRTPPYNVWLQGREHRRVDPSS